MTGLAFTFIAGSLISFISVLLWWPLTVFLFLFRVPLRGLYIQAARRNFFIKTSQIYPGHYLFFCSSAGEFEQALPLAYRIKIRKPETRFVYCFFSHSALRFAEARGFQDVCFLAPPDNFISWFIYFLRSRPTQCVVVRHELWPCFLLVARLFCGKKNLSLINTAESASNKFRSFLRSLLLGNFGKIFCVSHTPSFINPSNCFVCGDTKYDRVLDRAALQISHKVDVPKVPRLCIVGSAWPADARIVLNAAQNLDRKITESLTILIVPHEICGAHSWIKALAIEFKIDIPTVNSIQEFWEKYKAQNTNEPRLRVYALNGLGMLAEAYRLAEFAFVGGGMDRRVHNVLEPAAYDLRIACGPLYTSQTEAVRFVEEGVLTVCRNIAEAAIWLDPGQNNKVRSSRAAIKDGASETIVKILLP